MSKIGQIRALVRNGLYYLTEHADDEALDDRFDIYDVEYVLLNGHIRRTWPREGTNCGTVPGSSATGDRMSDHQNEKGASHYGL